MRLCALLDEAKLGYVLYNTISDSDIGDRVISVRRSRLLWYALTGNEPAVYLASQRIIVWLVGAFMQVLRGKRVAVRLPNVLAVTYVHNTKLRGALTRFALRKMSAVVCVNQELAEMARSIGVDPRRIHLFPGFLPPSAEDRDPVRVSQDAWDFLRGKSPVIAANGKVDSWEGEDLYGLDLLVDLAARLKPEYPDIGIIVCFWDHPPEDQPMLDKLNSMARAKGVDQNIFFNTKKGLFVPVIERADLFVRPTNTDGDANSIREALHFGVPVVASDVVERPEGTILFRTRDMDDFEAKTREALRTLTREPCGPSSEANNAMRERIKAYVDFLWDLAGTKP